MSPERSKSLGESIQRRREALELSLGELEKRSGVTKGYLSQLERGEATNPSLETVRKIAQGLEVELAELVGEEERAPASPAGKLPAGLTAFLARRRKEGQPLTDADVRMLLGIQRRGKQPRTEEDFRLLFEMIQRFLR